MATAYEWVVEEMDDEDIVDVQVFDSFSEAKAALDDGCVLALRKLKSNRDGDSVDCMAYAYFENGELDCWFDDGGRVPARYLQEATA